MIKERLLLLDVDGVERGLAQIESNRALGLLHPRVVEKLPPVLPRPAQLVPLVTRMWHRLVFEGDVGVSAMPPRPGWRPRVLQNRAVRFPFLLKEGSVVPFDLTGLRSSTSTLVTHLLGTHHEARQAVYDLELLAARDPSSLLRLRDACRAVVAGTHPRASLWRDLCVYERYHEQVLELVEEAVGGEFAETEDADVSFFAALRSCVRSPACN